jgi:hypothetical protein
MNAIGFSGWTPLIPDGVTEEDYEILLRQQRCVMCAKRRTPEGHDPCIPKLPGLKFACCGHGQHEAYAVFKGGQIIRGEFDHLKEGEPAWFPGLEP